MNQFTPEVLALLHTAVESSSLGMDERRWCLSALMLAQRPTITFTLHRSGQLDVDGQTLMPRARATHLLWWLLAAHHAGASLLPVDQLWQGRRPGACAVQAFQRAAEELEPVSRYLASIAAGVRTQGGLLLLPAHLQADVNARLDLGVTSA